jgi:hypothetical protein
MLLCFWIWRSHRLLGIPRKLGYVGKVAERVKKKWQRRKIIGKDIFSSKKIYTRCNMDGPQDELGKLASGLTSFLCHLHSFSAKLDKVGTSSVLCNFLSISRRLRAYSALLIRLVG